MRVFYFLVGDENQFHRINRKTAERIWRGEISLSDLALENADEIRVVTVLCDDQLMPRLCYFLRLGVENQRVSSTARLQAIQAICELNNRNLDHHLVKEQFNRWPSDWRTQLAVALDVPASEITNVSVGGLFPLAEALGVPLPRLIHLFAEAFQSA